MDDINKFLEEHELDGTVIEGNSNFSINYKAARDKLAKFQLEDPHEFILKFVQAANLGAKSIGIWLNDKPRIVLRGWNSQYTLADIVSSLGKPTIGNFKKAEDFLRVGLAVLLLQADDHVKLIQKNQGEALEHWVDFKLDPVQQTNDLNARSESSSLEIHWQPVKNLENSKLKDLLTHRCSLTHVPILLEGKELKLQVVETSGEHRSKAFSTNTVLARSYFNARRDGRAVIVKQVEPDLLFPNREQGYTALFQMTVDQHPKMDIWLTKAGVLSEHRLISSVIPGVCAFIEADDQEMDLTGSKFRESVELGKRLGWAVKASTSLLDPAIEASKTLAGTRGSVDSIIYLITAGFLTIPIWVFITFFISSFNLLLIKAIPERIRFISILLLYLGTPPFVYIRLIRLKAPPVLFYARMRLKENLTKLKNQYGHTFTQ